MSDQELTVCTCEETVPQTGEGTVTHAKSCSSYKKKPPVPPMEYVESDEDDDDGDGLTDDERLRRRRYQTPMCCATMNKHKSIVLGYDYGDTCHTPRSSLKPIWILRIDSSNYFDLEIYRDRLNEFRQDPDRLPLLKACPYCAAALPAIVPVDPPPSPMCSVTDGGYYCDTCKERLDACVCYPEFMAWQAAPSPPETDQK